MRMLPSRYMAQAKPIRIKQQVAAVQHVQAPLKGLSIYAELKAGDPLLAPILDNFIVEEDRITCRGGTMLISTHPDANPIACLVPFYGQPSRLAAATNGKLANITTTATIKGGFTSDDWHWTSFSNLSDTDYTVMVNGRDGVWSWDGGLNGDPQTVPVVVLDNLNPVRVTVASENIGRFVNGVTVVIAGGVGEWAFVNGPHIVGNVGVPAPNSFELVGVDGTVATIPQVGGGATAALGASMVKEIITAPAGKPYIVPDQFQIVVSHMNRLWFADNTTLGLYYLPLQQKSGELKELPLNAIFKRGGSIRAVYTWTVDGGTGIDDQLVIFSTNGEAAIYNGTDPDSDFNLTGIYRFDSPMSKHSVVNYGGELYCLISTGLVPMSTLMRAESEQLGKSDRNIFTKFDVIARTMRDRPGWMAILNHSSGRIICNQPLGALNSYQQLVRFMPAPVWASWSGLPSRCWGWVDNRMFFGSDDGKVYEINPTYLNDDGQPIKVDVQAAWSAYRTPAQKQFKMLRAYIISDGVPKPHLDMRVDYDTAPPFNQPDITEGSTGSEWDTADWDTADWANAIRAKTNWQGVAAKGGVGAPRMTALIRNCTFSVTGWDVLYEPGSVL